MAAVGHGTSMEDWGGLTARMNAEPELRSTLAANTEIWKAALAVKPTPDLMFLNNITACTEAGQGATEAGVLSQCLDFARNDSQNRLGWQITANLSQSTPNDSPYMDLPFGEALVSEGTTTWPALIAFGALCRRFPGTTLLQFIRNGTVMVLVQRCTVDPEFMTSERISDLVLGIFKGYIVHGYALELILEAADRAEWTATLLKLFDAVFATSLDQIPEGESQRYADWLSTFLKDSIPVICKRVETNDRDSDMSLVEWQALITALETASVLVSHHRESFEPILEPLILLLKTSKLLPAQNKLKTATAEPNPRDFPLIRTTTLPLVGALVNGNTQAQDAVRTLGGIEAVLECCVIDANNPFMKERAIVCIRFLLENNEANQTLVGSLEARNVANPDILADAGYETDITDGRVSVKRRRKN